MYCLILILPFFIFYNITPFLSSWTFGGDFLRFALPQQIELMFSLRTGSFPLYIPGFACGQSSAALTLGQLYHPMAWISSLMPGYWTGLAADWNVLFRLLTLGAAQALLYTFLRRLGAGRTVCFLLSFVTAYNLQLLNGFYFGASAESWTGHLVLCGTIGLYYLSPATVVWPLAVVGSTYWLVCSGHPQMMYYGLIGAALFTLVLPFFCAVMKGGEAASRKTILTFWTKTLLLCGGGIFLSSAYLLPYYFDFMASSHGHVGQDYAWSNMYLNTFVGTINDFFQPLDGGAGFGGSSLVLVAAIVPLLSLLRVRVPAVISIVWVLLLLLFLSIQGDRTPVHYVLWKIMPFSSGMRVPQRMSMIMPVFFMLILVWLLKPGGKPVGSLKAWGMGIQPNAPMVVGLAGTLCTLIYAFLPGRLVTNPFEFSTRITQAIQPGILTLYLVTGIVTMSLFVLAFSSSRLRRGAGVALCLLSIGQVFLVLHYGIPFERKTSAPTSHFRQIVDQKRITPDYQYLSGEGTSTAGVLRQAEQAYLEPFLGVIYREHIPAGSHDEAYARMQEGRRPDQVVIEGYHDSPSLLPGNDDPSSWHKASVRLTYNSYNRLVFAASSPAGGFFGLSYPYTGHWKAFVNDQEVPVYRANGNAHAVDLPAGKSRVEFRYWSDAVWYGMILSCSALAIIGFVFIRMFPSRRAGYVFWILCLAAGMGIFGFWYQSLYRGENLETAYFWKPGPVEARTSIAYGRRTQRSPNEHFDYLVQYPYLFAGGRAVDGDRSPHSGFITGLQEGPWWQVDLHKPERIGSVVLHESDNRYFSGDAWNVRPLMLLFSNDGENWNGTTFTHPGPRIDISLPGPVTARYVMIRSAGTCRLSFDEVEVLPPE
jgi:hypothetical protein